MHQLDQYKDALYKLYNERVGASGSVQIIKQEILTEVTPIGGGRPYKVRNGKIDSKNQVRLGYSDEAAKPFFRAT